MKHASFPSAIYQTALIHLNTALQRLQKRKNFISWARLLVILLLLCAGWYWYHVNISYLLASAVLLTAIFIRLIILAANNNTAMENIRRLIRINQQETDIGNGDYTQQPDGSNFISPAHLYASDLDIFGRASVYQYINRTRSEQGNATLADWLLQPAQLTDIINRQTAATELSATYQWRQQLEAYGMEQSITLATQEKIAAWLQEKNSFLESTGWKITSWLYPSITITLVVLYSIDILPDKWFVAAYIFALAASGIINRLVSPRVKRLNKIVPQLETLFESTQWIESNSFKSQYLQQLQQRFISNGQPASVAIKKIKNILDKFDYNLNLLMAMILNPLVLWDLQLVLQLEKWRVQHQSTTLQWFAALGEMEAVCSLGNLRFNHPHWAFPVFDTERHGSFVTTGMAHPLIPEDKMVCNNFSTEGAPQIALITGSNMAGKSTFLRSTAVNLVLAMMGAPVCASQLLVSPMRVISSMRVADNLEESTSTFYAELKKLKSIIEAVNRHEKVFILLDEILRGTNSLDRHTGSKALVKQLVAQLAVGLLATHDVELAQLQQEYPTAIQNFHFDAQIAGEELYFDYRLKTGICTSINASILMKKIGIEV